MADEGGKRKRISGRFEFVGLEEAEWPELQAVAIDPEGSRRAIDVGRDGSFSLEAANVGKGWTVEIEPRAQGAVRRYAYDRLAQELNEHEVVRIPKSLWERWPLWFTCVSGDVRVCRPWWWGLFDLTLVTSGSPGAIPMLQSLIAEPVLPAREFVAPVRCDPVCQGKVEVLLRTCCCDPPVILDPPRIIEDLCRLIGCPPQLRPPPPFPPVPWPPVPPEPVPRPDLSIDLASAAARTLERTANSPDSPGVGQVIEAARHLHALQALTSPQAQVAYIEREPWLRRLLCRCTSSRVAEVPLQPDGGFTACFHRPVTPGRSCSLQVAYRVSQIQEGNWAVVYDGHERGEWFDLDEFAELRANATALACDDPIWPEEGLRPFVSLEQIGTTWADVLIHSTQQNGEASFTPPLAAKDGMAWEAPPAASAVAWPPYDQPWGGTLKLRYQFHPKLEDLGITHFRTRVARVDAFGNPVTTFTLSGGLSWRKYQWNPATSSFDVVWVPLQTAPGDVGSIEGLYRIPFPDTTNPWLGGQWHAVIDTAEKLPGGGPRMPNGRYLFIVDVFDSGGNRLVPDNVAGTSEITRPYDFRRLTGPIDSPSANTLVVPHEGLASLFRVDNTPADVDIQAIVHNATASSDNCQFLAGPGSDTLRLQYKARHQSGYQWRHRIRLRQGLTGPVWYLSDTALQPPGSAFSANDMPGGGGSDTVAVPFETLLPGGGKCAFGAWLWVQTKHTDGHYRRIDTYDRGDDAAFAVENTS